MTKTELQNREIASRLDITWDDANVLRRAERTLHTWAEQECGDGNDYMSWSIERDETTNKPYRVVYPHTGESRRTTVRRAEGRARMSTPWPPGTSLPARAWS